MTLSLDLGTKPAGLEVRTYGFDPLGSTVFLGEYEISLKDFLAAAHYVLINTDLEPDDPRPRFVECIRSMSEVKGFNSGGKRLEAKIPLFPTKST